MANEVTTPTNNALAAAQALKGNLQKAKAAIPEAQGSQFLRFLQDGNWVFGQENAEVGASEEVAINPLSIKTGFSCWTNRKGRGAKNENLGEVMVPLGADAINAHDLPVKKDVGGDGEVCAWKEQFSVEMTILTGAHKGKMVLYKTSSVGGCGAMNALLDQIMLQLDEDPEGIVPIVNLKSDHYNHTTYGRTYTPVVSIIEWGTMDEVKPTSEGKEVDAPETAEPAEPEKAEPEKAEPEKPVTRKRKRPVVEDAEVVDETPAEEAAPATEEAPAPRRRRR